MISDIYNIVIVYLLSREIRFPKDPEVVYVYLVIAVVIGTLRYLISGSCHAGLCILRSIYVPLKMSGRTSRSTREEKGVEVVEVSSASRGRVS